MKKKMEGDSILRKAVGDQSTAAKQLAAVDGCSAPQSLETFGQRFRFWRKANGFRSEDLGKIIGLCDESQLSRYETGKSFPPIPRLAALAAGSDIDLHWLITGEKSPTAAAIEKTLKPYARAHLNEISAKLQALESELLE